MLRLRFAKPFAFDPNRLVKFKGWDPVNPGQLR